MHWSLDQVRDLDSDEYDELIAWAKDRAERSNGDDDGSVDMDAVIDAKKRKDERDGSG